MTNKDVPEMPKGKDIRELQYQEGVAIVCAIRDKADWCHNNNGNRTFEDWERMNRWLLEIADRLEYGLGYRRDEKIIKEIEEDKKSFEEVQKLGMKKLKELASIYSAMQDPHADKDALTEEFFNKLGEES